MAVSNYRFSGSVGSHIGKFAASHLLACGYHFHHSAYHRGYASVDNFQEFDCYCYNGRFGNGIIRLVHHTSQHVIVEYWVR